jgi:hypothetical protein
MADWKFIRTVLFRAAILFVVANLLFVFISPNSSLANVSGYNVIFPGRLRFPFGENPQKSYNFSLYSIDALFSSHEISKPNPGPAYRIFLLGDSSVWGTLLRPSETLAGQLNTMDLKACDGRPIHFFNLGYPTLSLTKDLVLLDQSMKYHPDEIIWLFTMESFPQEKQLTSPIIKNNLNIVQEVGNRYQLKIDPGSMEHENFWDKTIMGQRRNLADLIRLQLYGISWAATGIDQEYPDHYPAAQRDFEKDLDVFDGYTKDTFQVSDLSTNVLSAGIQAVQNVPISFVNEPIMISRGKGSSARYNFYYPRWAYDLFRDNIRTISQNNRWKYYDYWDLVPEQEYTNSAIHLTPAGESKLANQIATQVIHRNCK